MKKIKKTHLEFINNLPDENRKKVFLKILIIGVVGFISSLISVIIVLISLKYNPKIPDIWKFSLTAVVQDLPIFFLVLLLFFRGKFKKILSKILPLVSNKSPLIIFGVLLLYLILGIIINLITYLHSGSAETIKWLENYTNSGTDTITLNYLYTILQSLIIFTCLAFFEEFIFRFTIFRSLRKKGLIFALIVSSFLFAIIHGYPFQSQVYAFLFAVIIALYYEYTNNFFGAVLIHALHNLLIIFYSYYFTYQILQLKIFN